MTLLLVAFGCCDVSPYILSLSFSAAGPNNDLNDNADGGRKRFIRRDRTFPAAKQRGHAVSDAKIYDNNGKLQQESLKSY